MEKAVITGLGLMGGSFALALKQAGLVSKIIGIDQNPEHAKKAIELGIADEIGSSDTAMKEADLVVLAVPVNILPELLFETLDKIGPQTIVIDLGSTKQNISEFVKNHPKRTQYVATHPIAGTENSGPESAFAELFRNKKTILCDTELSRPEFVKKVEEIYKAIGMDILTMPSDKHDLHIAYVSHLSHLISYCLANAVMELEKDESTIFNMAGSGFASTVRLAKSSAEMWTPIFSANKNNLLEAIDNYQHQIEILKEMIQKEDNPGVYQYLEHANRTRKILN